MTEKAAESNGTAPARAPAPKAGPDPNSRPATTAPDRLSTPMVRSGAKAVMDTGPETVTLLFSSSSVCWPRASTTPMM